MADAAAAIRRHVRWAYAVILLVGGSSLAWSALATLDSAVVTQGTVVVESNVKKVQHPTGGIVGEINVREGQRVAEGDIVVRLDETMVRANLGVVVNDLTAQQARWSRLVAERDGSADITFPVEIMARATHAPDVAQVLAGERQLFKTRSITRHGQRLQLVERIGQLREEIKGLGEQKSASDIQLRIARAEFADLRGLQAKGLVQRSRITALEREIARNEGSVGEIAARVAQSQGKILETELQILQLDKDAASDIAKDLREAETKIGELLERKITAEDQLKRIDIRAPIAGLVHQLAVHTVGGVVNQMEPLMLIVPEADRLVVEMRINPQDIDQVKLGQAVRIRFSAFNHRTTPELDGVLFRVSGDLTKEAQTGVSYYLAAARVEDDEIKRLGAVSLVPGMPAEAYIRTGTRSPASYLVKPLTDQMHRAMRER